MKKTEMTRDPRKVSCSDQRGIFIMKVVDIQAFLVLFVACIAQFLGSELAGYFEPSEGIFIMKVVDIQAFSVIFVACNLYCPVFRVRISGVF